jgi:hypothetical protein
MPENCTCELRSRRLQVQLLSGILKNKPLRNPNQTPSTKSHTELTSPPAKSNPEVAFVGLTDVGNAEE